MNHIIRSLLTHYLNYVRSNLQLNVKNQQNVLKVKLRLLLESPTAAQLMSACQLINAR